jgi:hypothetical protein
MLVIDDLLAPNVSVDKLIERLLLTEINGLRRA